MLAFALENVPEQQNTQNINLLQQTAFLEKCVGCLEKCAQQPWKSSPLLLYFSSKIVLPFSSKNMPQNSCTDCCLVFMLLYGLAASIFVQPLAASKIVPSLLLYGFAEFASPSPSQALFRKSLQLSFSSYLNLLMKE